MQRIILAGIVLIAVTVVVAAQPPSVPPITPPVPPGPAPTGMVSPPARPGDPFPPAPPQPLPMIGVPLNPAPPAAAPEVPLSQFEPLSAYPAVTQFAVSGVLRGSTWMAKMNQSHGRFLHGYNRSDED